MSRNSAGGSFFTRPTQQHYGENCDMLFFCEKNAQTYRLCYSGAPLTSKRCAPADKNLMLMFSEAVHRMQLMDDTVKQLQNELSRVQQRPESSAPQRSESTHRFEQSQAASLIGSINDSAETVGESAGFSPGIPAMSPSISGERERSPRRRIETSPLPE